MEEQFREVVVIDAQDNASDALSRAQRMLDTYNRQVQRVKSANVMVRVVDAATAPLRAITSAAGSAASALAGVARTMGTGMLMGAGMAAFSAVQGIVGQATSAIFGMNSTLETATLQFETLMGSADEAKQHVADLFQFAKATPFETGPIIESSRLLRTFGGAALDTMANLTLFGDAAAATNAPINELSFWIGRMYASIQAGKPFGEALARLQELAVLSPEASKKLTEISSAGGDMSQAFGILQKDLGRFTGAMEKQAGTWTGVVSTFSDVVALGSAKLFAPLFTAVRDGLGSLNTLLSGDEATAWLDMLGTRIADGVQTMIGVFQTVQRVVGPIFAWFSRYFGALVTAVTGDAGAFGLVGDLIEQALGPTAANMLRPFLQALMTITRLVQSGDIAGALREAPRILLREMMVAGRRIFAYLRENAPQWFASIAAAVPGIAAEIATQWRGMMQGIADELGIGGPVKSAFDWITGTAFPLVQDAASRAFGWLSDTAWPALRAGAGSVLDWLSGTALPAVQGAADAAFGWLRDVAWPALRGAAGRVLDWLSNTALPAVRGAADAAFGWLRDIAWPALRAGAEQALGWISGTALPAIEAAAAPAVQSLRNLFATFGTSDMQGLGASLAALGTELTTALAPAIAMIAPLWQQMVASFAELGGTLAVQVGPLLQALGPLLQELAPIVGAVVVVAIMALLDSLRQTADILTVVIPAAVQIAIGVINALTDIIKTIKVVVQDIVDFVNAVAVGDWAKAWDALNRIVTDWGKGMATAALDIVAGIAKAILGAMDQLGIDWRGAWGRMTAGLDALRDAVPMVKGWLDQLAENFRPLLDIITKITDGIKFITNPGAVATGAVNAGADALGLPHPMARGGIVTRPTFAMLGERGPEAVVPLPANRAEMLGQRGGGSGSTLSVVVERGAVQMTVPLAGDSGDAIDLSEELSDALMASIARKARKHLGGAGVLAS